MLVHGKAGNDVRASELRCRCVAVRSRERGRSIYIKNILDFKEVLTMLVTLHREAVDVLCRALLELYYTMSSGLRFDISTDLHASLRRLDNVDWAHDDSE